MNAEEELRAAGDRLVALSRETGLVLARRDAAIAELRAGGWGLDRLAKLAGVSKSRMQTLVNRLENGKVQG